MRKKLAAVAIAAGVTGALAGCGPAGYPSATYCVDQMGQVVSPNYCDSGYMGGGGYMLFMGSVHNHSYTVGQRIPRSYISSGREIRPNDTAARKSAGLPFSGSVGNGTRVTTKPAAPQQAPKSPSTSTPFGGSSKATKPSTSTRSTGGFSGSTSRSSSSSSSRSSSSGGRR